MKEFTYASIESKDVFTNLSPNNIDALKHQFGIYNSEIMSQEKRAEQLGVSRYEISRRNRIAFRRLRSLIMSEDKKDKGLSFLNASYDYEENIAYAKRMK